MPPEAEARVRSRGSLGRRCVALAVLSAVGVIAGGCMVGPNYARPAVEQPGRFKSQADSEAAPPVAPDWWRLYREPELDRLVAAANASNQSLRQAVARVDQARALARVAGSFLYPTVAANPTYQRLRSSGTRDSTVTGQRVARGVDVDDWLVPFDLTYEIDVWGRVRRSFESARAQAAASADDVAVVQLTVQTDVARYYFLLRSLDAQTQILADTVAAYREQVRVLSVQLRSGLVSPVVVYQAQAQLQATLSQLRDVERARADQEHALAILCGRPAPLFTIASNPLHEASPPDVPPGLPAQLLARRPDVAEAEQNVVAANAQIGVATADFYPTFTLTGAAGFQSADASSIFNWRSRVAAITPSISFPIFQKPSASGGIHPSYMIPTSAAHPQHEVEGALKCRHVLKRSRSQQSRFFRGCRGIIGFISREIKPERLSCPSTGRSTGLAPLR